MKIKKTFLRKGLISKREIVVVIILLYFYSFLFSQNFGTNTAEFIKIKPEAEISGTGESGIAISDGTSALSLNPGRLALLDRSEVTLGEILWFNNIHMEYLAFAFTPDYGTGIGVNLFYIDFGNFDSTGSLAEPISIQNAFLNLGFGKSFSESFSMGICAKGIYENFINEKNFGLSFDAGVVLTLIERTFYTGMLFKNFGFLFGGKDPLPMEIGFGIGFKFFQHSFDFANIALDISKIINTDNIFIGAGFEYYFLKTLGLRLGIKYNNANDMEHIFNDIQNFLIISGGVGLNFGDTLLIDYSYSPMGDIGIAHRISLKFKFGSSYYEEQLAEKKAVVVPKAIEVPEIKAEAGEIKAVSFKPTLPEEKIKEWKLDIKTSDGKIIKSFSGFGEIPKTLKWDGTDNLGQIVKADIGYIYDFKVKDIEGKITKSMGKIQTTKKYEYFKFDVDKAQERFIPEKGKEMLVIPIASIISADAKERQNVPFVMENKDVIKIKAWEFNIFNKNGNIVKTFSGKNVFPSYLIWDGKDMNGNYVDETDKCDYLLILTGLDGKKREIKDRKLVRNPFIVSSKDKVIKVLKKIYFNKRSYEIMPDMQEWIKEIADEIKKYKKVNVFIQGHSSDEGTSTYNKTISEERAKIVLRALVENYDINPNILSATGYSNNVPAVKENTEEDAQQNRRVEIILLGEE